MKKGTLSWVMLMMAVTFSGCTACHESLWDKTGDNIAALRQWKWGIEKDEFVTSRSAIRRSECTEEKELENKKAMGL